MFFYSFICIKIRPNKSGLVYELQFLFFIKIVILPLMMILIRSASELLRETEHQNATYMYIIKMETLRPWHLREKISSMIGIPVLLRPGQTFGPSE